MAKPEYEHRIRFRKTGEPDSYAYPCDQDLRSARGRLRDHVGRSDMGGEVEVERRAVGPWEGVGEKDVIDPPAGG